MLYSFRSYRLFREADTSKLDALLNDPMFGGASTGTHAADAFLDSLEAPEPEEEQESNDLGQHIYRVFSSEPLTISDELANEGIDDKEDEFIEYLFNLSIPDGDARQELEAMGLKWSDKLDVLKYLIRKFKQKVTPPEPSQSDTEASALVKKIPEVSGVEAALKKYGIRTDDPTDLGKLIEYFKAFIACMKDLEKAPKVFADMSKLGLNHKSSDDVVKYIVFSYINDDNRRIAAAKKVSKADQIRQQLMDDRDPTEDEAIEMLQQYIMKINPPYHKEGMPQIPEISYMTGRFDSMLGHHNISRTDMTVKVDQVQPLQKDFNFNAVRRMMNKGYKNKPLLVIDDGTGPYKLIDGHHKWAAIWCKMKMHPEMVDGKAWNQVPITVLKPPKNMSVKQVLGILSEISQTISDRHEAEGSLTIRKEMEAKKDKIDAMAARFLSRFKTVGDLASEPDPAPQPAAQPPVEKAAAPAPAAKRGFAARYSASKLTQPAAQPTPAPAPEPTPPQAPAKKRGFASRLAPKTESRKRRSWFFS